MCVPASPSSALLSRVNMLALQLMTDCVPHDDNNNTCLSPGALKALTLPKPSLKRCLFGAPSAQDNARIIEEDLEANRARMSKLWSWDVVKNAPESLGSLVWEKVKKRTLTPARRALATTPENRHHPYPGAVRIERTSSGTSTTIDFPHVPEMISPIPPTPTVPRVRMASTSSQTTPRFRTTSISSTSEDDEDDSSKSSTLSRPSTSDSSWSPTTFSAQIACSVKVQTRLTGRNNYNCFHADLNISGSFLGITKANL